MLKNPESFIYYKNDSTEGPQSPNRPGSKRTYKRNSYVRDPEYHMLDDYDAMVSQAHRSDSLKSRRSFWECFGMTYEYPNGDKFGRFIGDLDTISWKDPLKVFTPELMQEADLCVSRHLHDLGMNEMPVLIIPPIGDILTGAYNIQLARQLSGEVDSIVEKLEKGKEWIVWNKARTDVMNMVVKEAKEMGRYPALESAQNITRAIMAEACRNHEFGKVIMKEEPIVKEIAAWDMVDDVMRKKGITDGSPSGHLMDIIKHGWIPLGPGEVRKGKMEFVVAVPPV